MSHRFSSRRGGAALMVAAAAGVSLVAVATPAAAATRLPCSARMSNSAPRQYSTDYVLVSTARSAAVRTTAHYRTTVTTHTASANRSGKASVAYRISRATKGYRVVVWVTVRKGSATGSCSTSFTPR